VTKPTQTHPADLEPIKTERTFPRFTLAQRWEHAVLIISVTILLLTGLPQKYQDTAWSQWIISTPERLTLLQQIHHIFALLLTAGALYHIGRGLYLLARRRLPADIFLTLKDLRDAWQMLKYLLFFTRQKPEFGKYNFEQKITYWFLFLGIAILISSGYILLYPIQITQYLPGGIIPAAYLAHSNEAIAAAVFIVIWHFFHVHIQRLNLSIFTGRMNEEEMRRHHSIEYENQLAKETDLAEKYGGKSD
jgi:formate dehydrogenase gamma subunit